MSKNPITDFALARFHQTRLASSPRPPDGWETARRFERAYRYLQSRLESLGYQGWAHDMDGEITDAE